VLVALLTVVEAGDVGCVGVDDSGVAVGHPLGNDLRHARAFLDPDGCGGPQVAHVWKLAQARHCVGGQREQTVDGVLDLGVTEHFHELDGFFHLLIEVVGRERHLGGGERGFVVRRNLVRVVQDWAVSVGADLHGACGLALVAEGVHVTNDRVADLVVRFDQHVDSADVGHLVHGGDEWDVGVGHVGHAVRPDAAGDDDVLGFDRALVGHDGLDLAHARNGVIFGDEVEDLGVREYLKADGSGLE